LAGTSLFISLRVAGCPGAVSLNASGPFFAHEHSSRGLAEKIEEHLRLEDSCKHIQEILDRLKKLL